MEYLEQLAREWYEYLGYFVRRDLWVGLEADGSYECQLDVVAYHPLRHHLVHLEPSLDLLPSAEKERHFQLKFDAGKKYLHRMFGHASGLHVEQIALVLASDHEHPHTIGGGRVLLLSELFAGIVEHLARIDPTSALVPEQWPLIRTLQFAAAYRARLWSVAAEARA
jgi:hypothetical protein